MKYKKISCGFTLIELIVIIAVLSIISFIAVPRYLKTLENARISAHNANVLTIKAAAMLYQADKGILLIDINELLPEYLDKIPSIPEGLTDYIAEQQYNDGYTIEVGDTYFYVTPGIID